MSETLMERMTREELERLRAAHPGAEIRSMTIREINAERGWTMPDKEPLFTIRIGDLRVTEGRQGHRAEIMHLNAEGGTSGYVVAWIDGKDGEYDILSVGMRAFAPNAFVSGDAFRVLAAITFDILTEIDRVAREGR